MKPNRPIVDAVIAAGIAGYSVDFQYRDDGRGLRIHVNSGGYGCEREIVNVEKTTEFDVALTIIALTAEAIRRALIRTAELAS